MESVITIFNKEGELTGIIRKDMVSRKNVFYTCAEMNFDELEALFKNYNVQTNL
jgi:hypothetical protein